MHETMLSYCLKGRKNTESRNLKVVKNNNGKIMFLSKYAVCNSKKLKFPKEQEIRRSLTNLPGGKIPILSH